MHKHSLNIKLSAHAATYVIRLHFPASLCYDLMALYKYVYYYNYYYFFLTLSRYVPEGV